MCSNYRPVTNAEVLKTFFNVERADSPNVDAWPTGLAPFIKLAEDGSGNKVVEDGHFGLLPHFAKELVYGRRTYNARAETVAEKPSYRQSWKQNWRCIVPAAWIYEPCYESGKAVRTRVHQPKHVPMGIAGIYNRWRDADGVLHWSFAMLTVNADGHPVFQRLHKPGDEKRMVVILDPVDHDRWLTCDVDEAKTFFKQWTGPLEMIADPLPPRRK